MENLLLILKRFRILFVLLVMTVFLINVYSAEPDNLLPTLKNMKFTLGGELEYEYVDTENDIGINNPHGHFQLDKFTLNSTVYFTENINLYAILSFYDDIAYITDGFLTISGLVFNSSLQIGLSERFIGSKPNRKTELYPLIDNFFTRYNDFGLIWYGKYVNLSWYVSMTNGLVLGTKCVSEDDSFRSIRDNYTTEEENENKEIGLGLGYTFQFSKDNTLYLLGYGYFGKLTLDEVLFLQGITGYGTSEDNKSDFYGILGEYKLNQLTAGFKYLSAQDGTLERNGWYIQLSYLFPLTGKNTSLEPLIRFGSLDFNLPPVPGDSLTWDRKETTIALLTTLTKGIMVKTEYYMNDENTGNGDVDNNEILIQLEIKF